MFMKEEDGRNKKLVRLVVVGYILRFLSHCENGVGIDRTLVGKEDNFALATFIHRRESAGDPREETAI